MELLIAGSRQGSALRGDTTKRRHWALSTLGCLCVILPPLDLELPALGQPGDAESSGDCPSSSRKGLSRWGQAVYLSTPAPLLQQSQVPLAATLERGPPAPFPGPITGPSEQREAKVGAHCARLPRDRAPLSPRAPSTPHRSPGTHSICFASLKRPARYLSCLCHQCALGHTLPCHQWSRSSFPCSGGH